MTSPRPTSDSATTTVQCRRVSPELNDALASFFRLVWGASGSGTDVAAARAAAAAENPVTPGSAVPEFVFLLNDTVIGYLGAVPVSFWNGYSETPSYWLKGLMVHPEHRHGPVGFSLVREAVKEITVTGAIAAAPAARRLLTAVGFVECGAIPNFLLVLRPRRFMSRIDFDAVGLPLPKLAIRALVWGQRLGIMGVLGATASPAQGIWRILRGRRGAKHRLQIDGDLPDRNEITDLWNVARGRIQCAAVRDGAFLSWRYRPAPGAQYEAANVRDSMGRLSAIAIVRRPADARDARLRGVKVAVLSDILFDPANPRAGLMALRGAEQLALRMGCDAVLCSATSLALTALLQRRAYLHIPANVFLLVRDPASSAKLSLTASDWWLTRGDGRSDDAF